MAVRGDIFKRYLELMKQLVLALQKDKTSVIPYYKARCLVPISGVEIGW